MKRRRVLIFGLGAALLLAAFVWSKRPSVPAVVADELLLKEAPERLSTTANAPDGGVVAPMPVSRRPASETAEDFFAKSEGEWRIRRSGDHVAGLAGSSFPLSSRAPGLAAAELLARFGEALFGVSPEDLVAGDIRQEARVSQAIFSQQHEGLPVLGARLNLMFDREGSLVYAVADLHRGEFPPPVPGVDPSVAARSAAQVLRTRLAREGYAIDEAEIAPGVVAQAAQLAYRLSGKDVALVYRFDLSLSENMGGDWEILTEAAGGRVVLLRQLSRK